MPRKREKPAPPPSPKLDRLNLAYNHLREVHKVRNQRDFTERVGYGETHMNQVFGGHRSITDKFAANLESTFGISKIWLLTGVGHMETAAAAGGFDAQAVEILRQIAGDIRQMTGDVRDLLNMAQRGKFTSTQK